MKTKILFALVPIILLTSFCGSKEDRKGIELTVKLSPETVTDSLFLKMDYEFKTAANFKKLGGNYSVFVHFWRVNSKEMLLQDDHVPLKDIGVWTANDTIRYSRTVFIPQFLNEFDVDFEGYEEMKLTVGLYNTKAQEKKIILFEKKINIQPASINAPEIVYDEGWNEIETDINAKDPFTRNWRWTTAKSVCIIENPKKECTLLIKGGVNKTVFQDQKLTVKINDAPLDEFIPDENYFSREYTVTPQMMGESDEFSLTFETDKVFFPDKVFPNSKDKRELGAQIFFIYFREKVK
ncbi:MAG: hypothetical protein PHX05_02620 [Acidobacteriota bacterium]|jgi:hypothetical protein|nr:hypothetical protein [Acidobacteriota bacterium]